MMNQDEFFTEDISRGRKIWNLSICMYINSFLSSFTVFYALLSAFEIQNFIDAKEIAQNHNYFDIKFWDSDLMFVPIVFNLFWIISGPWCDLILKLIPNKPRLISICANLLFLGGILSSLLLIEEIKFNGKTTNDFAIENLLQHFTANKILPGLLSGFGACLLRKQSLYVLQKYFDDNFHTIEVYLKSSFYLGSILITGFFMVLIKIDYLALVILYFLAASFNCFILLFYKNPTYDKAMVVSRYEILDNENEDLEVYVKVQEEIEKNFNKKMDSENNGEDEDDKKDHQQTVEPKYYKKIGESSKEVYADTSYSDKNQENVFVIEEEASASNPNDQVIYEYSGNNEKKISNEKIGEREKYITETANRLNNHELNKKDKIKIVDNTVRSRLMASFSKFGNKSQRKPSITAVPEPPKPIYSEARIQFDNRQTTRPRDQNCCSKVCEEFAIFRKTQFYPSLILYMYQRLMPLFFWLLLPLVLLRTGSHLLVCLTIYLTATIVGMGGNVLILKLGKMSTNLRTVYLSVFCMLGSMALYEVTMVYRTTTLAAITLVASFCITCSTSMSRLVIHDYLELQDLNKSRTILSSMYALCLVFSTLGLNNSTDAYYKAASFVNLFIGMLYGSFAMLRIWIKFKFINGQQ